MEFIKEYLRKPYVVLCCIFFIFMIFAVALATPAEIFWGLVRIIQSPDLLVTDYIEVGGLGSAIFNSALVGFISVLILVVFHHEPKGQTLATIWLGCGFAFFGKNLFNMMPILLGGYLFSRYVRQPFQNNVLAAILGTTLAPAVSQLALMDLRGSWTSLLLGIALGIAIGFVIEPIAKSSIRSHDGYNLYNCGFAAGIMGILIMSVFRNLGYDFALSSIWSSGNNFVLSLFLVTISVFLIAVGLIVGDNKRESLWVILRLSKEESDYYEQVKETCYINMGLLGLFATLLVNLLGVELSGPVIAAVFTIIGYGCYGKNLSNVVPLIAGALVGVLSSKYGLNDPNAVIAVLFATCLAPIAGNFGWIWGMAAGFLHLHLALNLGVVHGGLNLYNNGLAGGFAAMLLVPVIKAKQIGAEKQKEIEE